MNVPSLLRQQAPFSNIPTGTEAEVCADIARRQAHGLAKYGVSVRDNPLTLRQWLQHAYEEHLDAAVYLKRAMEALGPDYGPAPGCPGSECLACVAQGCRKADACTEHPALRRLPADGSAC